jgi:hypothetical protein
MERVYFTSYKGKKILIEDFSGMKPGPEFVELIAAAQKAISSQPAGSVLAVLDAANANYDTDILNRMKDFVKANKPYVKAACVTGLSGLKKVALSTLVQASGRSFGVMTTRDEAMEWLIQQ